MSVADKLGMGPKREVKPQADGSYVIAVTQPMMFFKNPKTTEVKLSAEQYEGYKRWQAGELIQDAMPDLGPSQREVLMSGMDDDDFAALAEDADEEE